MPSPVFNMIRTEHKLKHYRKRAGVPLKDVAQLLKLSSPNLIRYEQGLRSPTPEIILAYHILFGATLEELLWPMKDTIKKRLQERSQRLIDQYIIDPSSKRNFRLSYFREIVNLLGKEKDNESTN